jgi:hypothetical protein
MDGYFSRKPASKEITNVICGMKMKETTSDFGRDRRQKVSRLGLLFFESRSRVDFVKMK